MISVVKKKLSAGIAKKTKLTPSFCFVPKSNAQEPYRQGLLKLAKSDVDQNSQRIFQNKSVLDFTRTLERFFPENSLLVLLKRVERFFKINPLFEKFETLNYFSFKIFQRIFPKQQTVFQNKSVDVSDFFDKRIFLKKGLIIFLEMKKSFGEKNLLFFLLKLFFIQPETPINRGFQKRIFHVLQDFIAKHEFFLNIKSGGLNGEA